MATITERIFPTLYLDATSYLPKLIVSLIILTFWFYGIYSGYNWPKYSLIILGVFGGAESINNALNIFSVKAAFFGDIKITDSAIVTSIISYVLFLNGLIYFSTSLLLIFSKSLKSFLDWQRSFISILPKRERIANSIYCIGVAIAIAGASWVLTIGLINTISNPKLIIGFLLYSPIKIPLYAIPGILIMLLGLMLKRKDASVI